MAFFTGRQKPPEKSPAEGIPDGDFICRIREVFLFRFQFAHFPSSSGRLPSERREGSNELPPVNLTRKPFGSHIGKRGSAAVAGPGTAGAASASAAPAVAAGGGEGILAAAAAAHAAVSARIAVRNAESAAVSGLEWKCMRKKTAVHEQMVRRRVFERIGRGRLRRDASEFEAGVLVVIVVFNLGRSARKRERVAGGAFSPTNGFHVEVLVTLFC